ncbi:MAG: tetratricopeptide repeat protein [Proteobacteria bacterium]|nr:tetratricopeptide repeat protein [Pseudomonadota bacterium]
MKKSSKQIKRYRSSNDFLIYHQISIAVICLLGVIIYCNTLGTPFAFDDYGDIKRNSFIRLTDLDLQKICAAAFKSQAPTRFVANISFALNYYWGRYDVTGYHLINIIIHLINGILVYFLALLIFQQNSNITSGNSQPLDSTIPLMSLTAALIFTAHPLQTESVTYLVQRMHSMAAMFFLLSILLYIKGRLVRIKWQRWSLFFGCFIAWGLALGSKELAAILPFIIFLCEWYFFQDLKTVWLKQNLGYFLGIGVVVGLVAFIYLGGNPFDRIMEGYKIRDFTMGERVLTQFRVLIFYITLLIYPHPSRLNLNHDFMISHSLLNPITTLLSLLIIVGIIGYAVFQARKQRLVSFCILWFFANLVIESSFIALEMIYEHRLYLPLFGFALLGSFLLFHLFSNKRSRIIVAAVIILILGTATYQRNKAWHNRITLWSDVVSKSPNDARAHNNLGIALAEQGEIREARFHFSEAMRLKPDHEDARNNLKYFLEQGGYFDKSISHYYEALKINPDDADAHYNLGLALAHKGNPDKAIKHLSEALRIRPDFAEAHSNLGGILSKRGNLQEGIQHLSEALRLNPDNIGARKNYEFALRLMEKAKTSKDTNHSPAEE